MAPKKKKTGRKKTGHKKKTGQKGKGVFDKIGNFFKKGASTVWNAVKSTKPSTLLGLVPHPYAQGASKVAGAIGLGKRRRKTTTKTKSLRRLMGGAAKGIRPMRPTLMGAGAKKSLYTE